MYDIIVPVSGGKDSQACLKLASQNHPKERILGLFCDTGFEHPLTYEHIQKLVGLYGVEIRTLQASTVIQQVLKHGRFPAGNARFCTEETKIWPSKRAYRELALSQGKGFEVWYGVRSDESPERAKRYQGKAADKIYPPHEFMRKYPKGLAKLGVMFRLAVIDWSYDEVMDFLDGKENPLYGQGFERVGCFPCLASGDKWKEKAFNHDDFGRRQHAQVKELEKAVGRSVWTSQSGLARNCQDGPGCAICSI